MSTAENLHVVVVAPDSLEAPADDPAADSEAERASWLRIGLLESGYNIVAVLPADVFLPERLAQIDPDMIIVDAESQSRDTLEHVVMASREAHRPIMLFTDDSDMTQMPDVIAAGVTAYVVADLAPDRVKPVLDVALARFRHEETMRLELAAARNELSGRQTIARATGILMRNQGITENEAYGRLRKTAMDKGIQLADVAQRVIVVADLLT